MANVKRKHYEFLEKKQGRKICYGLLVRIYNRVTIPQDYNMKTYKPTPSKQKFEAFGFICLSCRKVVFDKDIKDPFQYLANRHRN